MWTVIGGTAQYQQQILICLFSGLLPDFVIATDDIVFLWSTFYVRKTCFLMHSMQLLILDDEPI